MPYIGKSPEFGVRSRFIFAATSSQTSFSGSDANGITLKYVDTAYLDVFQNGVLLKAGTDYTATTGTSVVLTTGASTDDVVSMLVYDVFNVADTVSASSGGSFSGAVAVTGTLTGTTVKGTTSLQSPLIEFTDGDDAIAIADAGIITIKNASSVITSEGGAVTTNITQGLAKCWCCLNGSSTAAIRDSFNTASITDNATGDYTVTATNAMSNINYAKASHSGTSAGSDGNVPVVGGRRGQTQTTTAVRLATNFNADGTSLSDLTEVNIVYLGDLA